MASANLVRQGNRGLSAAYDYEGHVMARMDHYQADELTMVSQIPTRGVRTLYSWFGDWAALLCVGILGFLSILAMRSKEVEHSTKSGGRQVSCSTLEM